MQSTREFRSAVSIGLSRGTAGTLWLLVLFLTSLLHAQSAGISTVSLPVAVNGPSIFDSAGNMYTYQMGPVTAGAYQTQNGGGLCLFSNGFFSVPGQCTDAYVGKFDPSGKLVFGTYLGGNTNDVVTGIALDAAGNIFITGTTSGGFPTTTGVAIPSSTTSKAFAAKFNPDGSRLLYSIYLPDADSNPNALAIDAQGNAFIAGMSSSGHAFILKLAPDASTIVYDVSLKGAKQDFISAIHSDALGNLVVVGSTSSPDFPVSANALQARLKGGQNLFLARIDPTGRTLSSTYLGGSGSDLATSLQTDAAGNVYIAGATTSLDFPTTAGSFESSVIVPLWNASGPGGFAAKLDAGISALTWSTFVMSGDATRYTTPVLAHAGVTQLFVTAAGDAYIAGLSGAGFPVTPSAPQPCFDGPNLIVFVARLDSRGALADATYVGASSNFPSGLSADSSGLVRIAYNSSRSLSSVRFGTPGSASASCLSPNILNSATFVPSGNIVPGELISLTGLGIGPETPSSSTVQVLFDGRPAPVLYAQSRQVNAQVPVELAGKSQTTISLIYNNTTVGSIDAKVDSYGAPGIFRLHAGLSLDTAVMNQDGTVNSPSNPAPIGSTIAMWGTGFGLITPPCSTGQLNPDTPVSLAPPLFVWFSEANPDPSAGPGLPTYSGSAPGLLCGIVQINRVIPAWVKPGIFSFTALSLLQRPQGDYYATFAPVPATVYVK
jgi:uncharacterized protein (TIGR03437 family)